MTYYDSDEKPVHGLLKLTFCKEAPKAKACESFAGSSMGYFTYFEHCVPLSNDESRPPATEWTMRTEGPAGLGEKLIFESDNSAVFNYNTYVTFTCADDTGAKVKANYKPQSMVFDIQVMTSFSCRQNIGEMTMTFHHYRYFIMTACMALGLFITYFGIYKLKKTLILFGFVFTFFFSLFLLTAFFHSGRLTSDPQLQYRACCHRVDSHGLNGRLRVHEAQALHQLRVQ